jgi:hypothetical protein
MKSIDMQFIYVNMQLKYVDMQVIFINIQLKEKWHTKLLFISSLKHL